MNNIKIIFIQNYLRCCKFPKRYISSSSDIDYINIVEIKSTHDNTRFTQNRFTKQKMLGNDRMETASTELTSIRRRIDIEKTTWKTHRYFVDFESRIDYEISASNRCNNLPFKNNEISTNFLRGISTPNRWRIDKDVSIG